jgi:serine/threonine protein kinase
MPSPNQRVGEYVLQDRIAAGTFGEVWRAHHHVWADQLVAVKIPTDSQYLRNLQREGVAMYGLHHPNIVRPLGFDPFADPGYLVMEYVPGTSLRTLISQRRLEAGEAVAILKQVLAGLSHAHAKGVVHRDVKPENILVHEKGLSEGFATTGTVKVTDFGLGKSSSVGAGSIAFSAVMNDPASKEIAGTLDYMAPEQRSGAGAIDGRADVYACGVVLYEMLTGERPAGTDLPSDLNPAVPKMIDEAFKRSYARLDKRFASADDFARALGPSAISPPPLVAPARITQLPVAPPVPWSLSNRHNCPQCRGAVDGNDQFCMHCGVQLVENVRRCPQCGAFPDASDHYCIFCGQALTNMIAMTAAVQSGMA